MKEEIIEGNKLIARYMDISSYHDNGLCYYFSWEALMPVVRKIEKDYWTITTTRDDKTSFAIHNKSRAFEAYAKGQDEDKLKAIWKGVVEFIKWHNQKQ